MAGLPPEVWLCVFQHAAHVPGALVPEIYAYVSHIGPSYTRTCGVALRETLVTTRALVRVCKQWWYLAVPFLYRSVYIGRVRCLSSLSSTLLRSVEGKCTIAGTRSLGEYTERLDIAIRDHSVNADAESDSLAMLIACMPHLAVVSFSFTSNYTRLDFPTSVFHALQYSADSLRVLNFSSPFVGAIQGFMDLLAKCTQLRILLCPFVVWSKEFEYGGFPSTLTTVRVQSLIPVQFATSHFHLPQNLLDAVRRPGPSALREIILEPSRDINQWKDLLGMYSDQLLSVQFWLSSVYSVDVSGHMQLLARKCPHLRHFAITSDRFSSFVRPHLVFPSIEYLGLRATRTQLPKSEFKVLFTFMEQLSSSVPSLRVVQLLNEYNVCCLVKTHTKFALRALRSLEASPIRFEDCDGVLLTGSESLFE